ncbi:hypothetical protein J437_LFUL006407 [Ladona fulva]|uniref:Uncharacterized protein n=1 Tax=Ladona fulva TaxID=123851 RepID=A0A8K0K8D3_LADFU|nr:hypothetical protein J437_LFUL006407 [Ladona fulva]
MDVKDDPLNKLAKMDGERLLHEVKTEPRLHSPCDAASQLAATSSLCTDGQLLSPYPMVPSSGTGSGGGKRPRHDDWLPSPSQASIVDPMSPSSGPGGGLPPGGSSLNGHPYSNTTTLSNGYASPMSSGSYDPYSPNGKLGESASVIDLIYETRHNIFPKNNLLEPSSVGDVKAETGR